MARYGSADVSLLLIDGYSVLGYTTEITENTEALVEETHVFGDTWVKREASGLKQAEFEQNGFYDDAANASNAALVGSVGSSRVLCFGVEGNTKGKQFRGFGGALQVNYNRVATRGELHKAGARYLGSGAVEDGRILHELAAETAATGNTQASSHDNAASSASGGAGYLQVSALTLGGYTSVSVVLQHSSDNVTFSDKQAFTNVTAAPDAERVAVSGTIERYTAVRWAFNGAGSGQSVTFMAGISRA